MRQFGGLSDSPSQAATLLGLMKDRPDRADAFDLFTYLACVIVVSETKRSQNDTFDR